MRSCANVFFAEEQGTVHMTQRAFVLQCVDRQQMLAVKLAMLMLFILAETKFLYRDRRILHPTNDNCTLIN